MIKAVEFPNKEFATKEELFAELKKNESRLIDLKKSVIHKSCDKGIGIKESNNSESVKSIENAKDGFIYPIISTTRYLDSHKDVHFDGCFNRTVKDQQGKVKYALDHELKFDSIIAWSKDVNMKIEQVDWSIVGKNYQGKTEALIFEIDKEKINRKDVLKSIENKDENFENSIRMIYVKIFLGLNSNEKKYKENKKYYDSRINSISNKEDVEEDGYFWGVEELKIWKEGSLVVAGGSNDATSIYEKSEPSNDTQEEQPSNDTATIEQFKELLSNNLKLK